jgi:hypothetical protein
MSSRFHNKYHRHNHHTLAINDPRYPDSSHDPIASPESPFLGDFFMIGSLSATAVPILLSPSLSSKPAGMFYGETYGIRAMSPNGIAVEAIGDVIVTGDLSANKVSFTNSIVNTTYTAATATGQFLVLNINGQPQGIRLWQLP